MHANNLTQLLTHEVQDLYSAERQILDALPGMVDKAHAPELTKALREHLEETRGHKDRLERVAKQLDITLDGTKCAGMAGILKEGDSVVGAQTDDAVRDAAIIASAQRVEHYEMAGYGTAVHFAKAVGKTDAAKTLSETLGEEKAADATLSKLADDTINARAMQAA